MKTQMNKTMALLLAVILVLTMVIPNPHVEASDSVFHIYVWVVDENGDAFTKTNYEPGFIDINNSGFPMHETVNMFGVALINISPSPTHSYRYFVYGKDTIYDKTAIPLTITKQYSVLKVNLETEESGKKTKYTLIEPDDSSYPSDPMNPINAPEKKVNLHGFVNDQNGGIPDAVVSIKNHSKNPEELYTITAITDSNGYYFLDSVDEKRFGTAQLSAAKDGVKINTITNQQYYSIGKFSLWDENKNYNFGIDKHTPLYSILVTEGTANHSLAPSGTKVTITANEDSGKRFDKWTSPEKVSFNEESSPVTWFIMPDQAVQINGVYSNIPIENTSVSAITITPSAIQLNRGTTCRFDAVVQGDGTVSQEVGWTVKNASGSSISADGLLTVSSDEKALCLQVMAISKADPEKFAVATVTVVEPSPNPSPPSYSGIHIPSDDKSPTLTPDDQKNILNISTSFSSKKNKSGSFVATITDRKLKNVITNAQKDSTGFENKEKHLSLDLVLKDTAPLQVVFSKEALDTIIKKDIRLVKIQGTNLTITFDKAFLEYVKKQSDTGLTFHITKSSMKTLGKEAKKVIGTHPVYQIRATYIKKSGKKNVTKEITDFRAGTVTVSLPYVLKKGENVDNVCAITIQKTGKPAYIKDSVYSTEQKQLLFPLKRFSVISIGIK